MQDLLPANCVTWFYSTLFLSTNMEVMEDSDDECQVIHCISFVDPIYLQHLRCLLEHHQLLVSSVRLQLS